MCSAVVKRRQPPFRVWFFLAFSLFLILPACRRSPQVIKIGLVAPFEGENRALGYDAIYAARLAIREINEAGGINGTRIALVALDDSGQVDLARKAARSLTLDPLVVAVIGHGLPETTAAVEAIYTAHGVPLLTLGAGSWAPFPAERLPPDFVSRYEAVTPFEETAGELAAPTYDGVQLIFTALRESSSRSGEISRKILADFLPKTTHQGITGPISYSP